MDNFGDQRDDLEVLEVVPQPTELRRRWLGLGLLGSDLVMGLGAVAVGILRTFTQPFGVAGSSDFLFFA